MPRPLRIAIVSHSLARGGAERFSATLGQLLDGLGHEIHHVTITEAVEYAHAGSLLNLGQMGQGTLLAKWRKASRLKAYLDAHRIEVVIDNRSRNRTVREWIYNRVYGTRRKIYVVHSAHLTEYFPLFAQNLFKQVTLVAVSKAIETKIERLGLKATTIYNPVRLADVAVEPNAIGKYLLYYGRIDDGVKNFGLLLDAFNRSRMRHNGFKLLLMGEGPDGEVVERYISARGLDDAVVLLPFRADPYPIVAAAYATVLTSRYEGFPMSLIESLALGVPVVSVDCESGPSEIVLNGENGLLVVNHDVHALADALDRMADPAFHEHCRANAQTSVAHLSPEAIGAQWERLLETI